MRQTRLAILTMAFLILFTVRAHAQLGPRDGGNLKSTDLERIKVGDTAPDFTLENVDGKLITLSNFRGDKNVVLVFYRGHW